MPLDRLTIAHKSMLPWLNKAVKKNGEWIVFTECANTSVVVDSTAAESAIFHQLEIELNAQTWARNEKF